MYVYHFFLNKNGSIKPKMIFFLIVLQIEKGKYYAVTTKFNNYFSTLKTESITVPSTHLIIATTSFLFTLGLAGLPPQI